MPETERMEKGLGYGSVSPVFTADLGTRVQSPRLSEKLGTVVCACNPSTGRQRPAAPWAEHQAAERFCLKDQLVASWKTTPKVAFCSPHVCTQRGGGGKEREEKTIEWRALSDGKQRAFERPLLWSAWQTPELTALDAQCLATRTVKCYPCIDESVNMFLEFLRLYSSQRQEKLKQSIRKLGSRWWCGH